MNIACLGWGSLIWCPRLPLRSPWFEDGPLLPIEFARHSRQDRVTLVLVPGRECTRSLWALIDATSLDEARRVLAKRERITKRIDTDIGFWTVTAGSRGALADVIGAWAETKQLDAVVWTALPPKWNDEEGTSPSCEQVIAFLRKQGDMSKAAEYVRKAPPQLATPFRREIERQLGWTHADA